MKRDLLLLSRILQRIALERSEIDRRLAMLESLPTCPRSAIGRAYAIRVRLDVDVANCNAIVDELVKRAS